MSGSLTKLTKELEKKTRSTFYLMEDFPPKPASPTLSWLLESKHLLISNPVGKLTHKFVDKLINIRSRWMYGDTSLGDEIWHHMFVQMAAVKKEIKKKDFASSLGKLLGIFLYTCTDDGWMWDNEMWDDKKRFTGWFTSYSAAWRQILARSDQELGLVVDGGREGGYRDVIIGLLENYVPSWNKMLDDIYNKDHGYNVKINILKKPVKKAAKKASIKVKIEEGNKAKNEAVNEPSTSSE